MNPLDKLEAWAQKVADAALWCQTTLKPGTWQYLGNGQFDFDNDQDYLMFILRTKEWY